MTTAARVLEFMAVDAALESAKDDELMRKDEQCSRRWVVVEMSVVVCGQVKMLRRKRQRD